MQRRELLSVVAGLGAVATVGVDRGQAGNDTDGGCTETDAKSDSAVTLDIVLTDE